MDVYCFMITAASPASPVGEKDFLHILVSSDSDSNDIGTFMSQRIPQKTETSVSYRKRVKTLLDVLQEEHGPLETFQETKTLSIENENAAEESVNDLPTEDHSTSSGQKSRQGRHNKLGGTGSKRPWPPGTTKISQQDMAAVRPGMKISSGIRWNVAMDQGNGYKHDKSKGNKKRKKSDSRAEEVPASLDSPPMIIRILAGTLVLLFSGTCVVLLW